MTELTIDDVDGCGRELVETAVNDADAPIAGESRVQALARRLGRVIEDRLAADIRELARPIGVAAAPVERDPPWALRQALPHAGEDRRVMGRLMPLVDIALVGRAPIGEP